MTLFLDEHHIAALERSGAITMRDLVDAVERAYRQQGEKAVQLLPRHNFWFDRSSTRGKSLKLGGAALPGIGATGVTAYTAGFRPGYIDLWIQLFSTTTGELLALCHGKALSQMKTGATAAVAARHMARPDARIVGLIGTGSFAETQLTGLAAVRPLAEVRCFSRSRDGRESFVARMRSVLPGIELHAVDDARAAVAGADIAVTVTTSRVPVLEGSWLDRGTHCNLVGAHYPEAREVDSAAVRRARVVVDDLDQAWGEKGEIMIPLAAGEISRDHVVGDLGSVVAGTVAGRTSADEITMFCSGGAALEYVGACTLLYERARATGVGHEFG
jgi:alanine dehydrogenase